jgi:hypothetical protein
MYEALSAVLVGVNVPVPLVVHCPVPEPPAIDPESGTDVTFAQIVVSLPAEAKPAGVIVTFIVSVDGLQLALFVELNTSNTDPASVSAGLKL